MACSSSDSGTGGSPDAGGGDAGASDTGGGDAGASDTVSGSNDSQGSDGSDGVEGDAGSLADSSGADGSAGGDDATSGTGNDTTGGTDGGGSALDQAIDQALSDGNVPGAAVAVVRGAELVYAKGYGYADVDAAKAMTADTALMLASVSKTVIAVAALQAVEAGLLDLDANINNYLTFDVVVPGAPETPITLRTLLMHTSGLRDDWDTLGELYVEGDSDVALAAFMQDLLTPGGTYYNAATGFTGEVPGAAYEYSDVGASLAALVIESGTNIAFDVWCKTRIFEPLGLTHTGWHLADLAGTEVALPYAWNGSAFESYGQYGYPDYPDGQLRTSVTDLSRFLRMVMANGQLDGVTVLPAARVEEMLTITQPTIAEGQGLIWYQYGDGEDVYWGHEGADQGVSTTMFFRPSDGVGVIVLTNGDEPEDEAALNATYEIEALLYDAVDTFPEAPQG